MQSAVNGDAAMSSLVDYWSKASITGSAFLIFELNIMWKVTFGCGKNHSQVRQRANLWLILLVREQPVAGTRIAHTQ